MPGPFGLLASFGDMLDIIERICTNTRIQWNGDTLKNWLCLRKWFLGAFTSSQGKG